MTIDPSAILALISDLTTRNAALQAENAQLREALANAGKPADTPA